MSYTLLYFCCILESIEFLLHLNGRIYIFVIFNCDINFEIAFSAADNDMWNSIDLTICHTNLILDGHPILSALEKLFDFGLVRPASFAAFIRVSILAGGCASSKYDLYGESRTLTLDPFGPFSCE